jgi:2-polyprenyl-6-methoxyphenol hydroxylase-like FAD-dependent oxidoreductase
MKLAGVRVAVVGGSLGGLSATIALEQGGAEVSLFERARSGFEERGGGLGLARDLVPLFGPTDRLPFLLHKRRHVWVQGHEWEEAAEIYSTSYGVLWRWLRAQVVRSRVFLGQQVRGVKEGPDGATLRLAEGAQSGFDLVILADGGASSLRGLVDEQPRSFAGYVLWRGLVSQEALHEDRFALHTRFHIANLGGLHLVAYAVPSSRAGEAPGSWAMNWGCYVPYTQEALTALQSRIPPGAPHALARTPEHLQEFAELLDKQGARWPDWALSLMARTLQAGALGPHPVFEFAPQRMRRGRVLLLGDAAHQASPITGAGARLAMEDALTLRASLERAPDLNAALDAYEAARAERGRRVVQEGHMRGASFRAPAR